MLYSENGNEPLTLGMRVKQARLNKKLSVTDLAELADLSRAYIHQIESDACHRPSAEVLYNLSKILDTSIAYLLGKVDTAESQAGVIEIPNELKQFAEEEGLTVEEVNMLAAIKYRNRKPKTVNDWKYIWESIKRSV